MAGRIYRTYTEQRLATYQNAVAKTEKQLEKYKEIVEELRITIEDEKRRRELIRKPKTKNIVEKGEGNKFFKPKGTLDVPILQMYYNQPQGITAYTKFEDPPPEFYTVDYHFYVQKDPAVKGDSYAYHRSAMSYHIDSGVTILWENFWQNGARVTCFARPTFRFIKKNGAAVFIQGDQVASDFYRLRKQDRNNWYLDFLEKRA